MIKCIPIYVSVNDNRRASASRRITDKILGLLTYTCGFKSLNLISRNHSMSI